MAALDIKIAGTVTPKRGDGARKANVHAQDARSPSVVFRVEAEATPDRPQRGTLSQSTVHDYVERFRAAGLHWPLPAEMSESELRTEDVYPADRGVLQAGRQRPHLISPTFISNCKGTSTPPCSCCGKSTVPGKWTVMGTAVSRHHYQRFKQERDLVLRQRHRPGEKLFVDWAGATMPLYDPATGQPRPARCSWLCWEPAITPMPRLRWISRWAVGSEPTCGRSSFWAAARSWSFPHNTRTGVSRACRYEPDLNPTYQEMAMHYAIGVLPTRPRKPRDKAKVEVRSAASPSAASAGRSTGIASSSL